MHNTRFFNCVCLISLLSFLYYISCFGRESTEESREIVLFAATPIFGRPLEYWNYLKRCPEEQKYCRISSNPEDNSKAAAVLFHNRDFKVSTLPRRKEQVYVWFTRETPVHEVVNVPEDYINWTMTYRSNSDVWYPYYRLQLSETVNDVNFEEIWKFKTKTATWLASNCVTENRRADLAKAMKKKGMELDIWGACGNPLPDCPRNKSLNCAIEHMRNYEFYLALENSNCPDYATEKFWFSLSQYYAVPIVMKRSYYSAYGIPQSALIALDDFSSIDDLVTYVHNVSSNMTAYLEHHKWRTNYDVVSDSATDYCELCRRMKNNNTPPKSYKNLSSWFSNETCDQTFYKNYL